MSNPSELAERLLQRAENILRGWNDSSSPPTAEEVGALADEIGAYFRDRPRPADPLREAFEKLCRSEGYRVDRESDGETYREAWVEAAWWGVAALATKPAEQPFAWIRVFPDGRRELRFLRTADGDIPLYPPPGIDIWRGLPAETQRSSNANGSDAPPFYGARQSEDGYGYDEESGVGAVQPPQADAERKLSEALGFTPGAHDATILMLNAVTRIRRLSGAVQPPAPTEAMLIAARDWSAKKYGTSIGDDAARGCWQAMAAVAAAQPPAPRTTAADFEPIHKAQKIATEVGEGLRAFGSGVQPPAPEPMTFEHWLSISKHRNASPVEKEHLRSGWNACHSYGVSTPPASEKKKSNDEAGVITEDFVDGQWRTTNGR